MQRRAGEEGGSEDFCGGIDTMYLPYAENLKIEYLSRVFDRNRISNCYKYFWFMAILRKVNENENSFSFDELINEMIADAWYMVAEYNLRLGPNNTIDNLEEVVKYLFHDLYKETVASSVSREKLLGILQNETDRKFLEYKSKLTNNVPYCMQTPFYDTSDRLLKNPGKNTIDLINRQERLMYYFDSYRQLRTTIVVDKEWTGYFIRNREILMNWTRYNLVGYLQDRNPAVPGIVDKILPPASRKLARVTKYWETVITAAPELRDIYGDNRLSEIKVSIDHFVPWQYVAHDELWNLHPTTKNINSSKGNHLPRFDKYFESLVGLEYKAYQLRDTDKRVQKVFEDCAAYHVNNSEVRKALYVSGLSREDFALRLENVISPVYEAAKNCGFREWVYE